MLQALGWALGVGFVWFQVTATDRGLIAWTLGAGLATFVLGSVVPVRLTSALVLKVSASVLLVCICAVLITFRSTPLGPRTCFL